MRMHLNWKHVKWCMPKCVFICVCGCFLKRRQTGIRLCRSCRKTCAYLFRDTDIAIVSYTRNSDRRTTMMGAPHLSCVIVTNVYSMNVCSCEVLRLCGQCLHITTCSSWQLESGQKFMNSWMAHKEKFSRVRERERAPTTITRNPY